MILPKWSILTIFLLLLSQGKSQQVDLEELLTHRLLVAYSQLEAHSGSTLSENEFSQFAQKIRNLVSSLELNTITCNANPGIHINNWKLNPNADLSALNSLAHSRPRLSANDINDIWKKLSHGNSCDSELKPDAINQAICSIDPTLPECDKLKGGSRIIPKQPWMTHGGMVPYGPNQFENLPIFKPTGFTPPGMFGAQIPRDSNGLPITPLHPLFCKVNPRECEGNRLKLDRKPSYCAEMHNLPECSSNSRKPVVYISSPRCKIFPHHPACTPSLNQTQKLICVRFPNSQACQEFLKPPQFIAQSQFPGQPQFTMPSQFGRDSQFPDRPHFQPRPQFPTGPNAGPQQPVGLESQMRPQSPMGQYPNGPQFPKDQQIQMGPQRPSEPDSQMRPHTSMEQQFPSGSQSQMRPMGPAGQEPQNRPQTSMEQQFPSGSQSQMRPTGQESQMRPQSPMGQQFPSGSQPQMRPMGPTSQESQMKPQTPTGQSFPSGPQSQMRPQHPSGPESQMRPQGPTGQQSKMRPQTPMEQQYQNGPQFPKEQPQMRPQFPESPMRPKFTIEHVPKGQQPQMGQERPSGPDSIQLPIEQQYPSGPQTHMRPKEQQPHGQQRPTGPESQMRPQSPMGLQFSTGPQMPKDQPQMELHRPMGQESPIRQQFPSGSQFNIRPYFPVNQLPQMEIQRPMEQGSQKPQSPMITQSTVGPQLPKESHSPQMPTGPQSHMRPHVPMGSESRPGSPSQHQHPKGSHSQQTPFRPQSPVETQTPMEVKFPSGPQFTKETRPQYSRESELEPQFINIPQSPLGQQRPQNQFSPQFPNGPQPSMGPQFPKSPYAHMRPQFPSGKQYPTGPMFPMGQYPMRQQFPKIYSNTRNIPKYMLPFRKFNNEPPKECFEYPFETQCSQFLIPGSALCQKFNYLPICILPTQSRPINQGSPTLLQMCAMNPSSPECTPENIANSLTPNQRLPLIMRICNKFSYLPGCKDLSTGKYCDQFPMLEICRRRQSPNNFGPSSLGNLVPSSMTPFQTDIPTDINNNGPYPTMTNLVSETGSSPGFISGTEDLTRPSSLPTFTTIPVGYTTMPQGTSDDRKYTIIPGGSTYMPESPYNTGTTFGQTTTGGDGQSPTMPSFSFRPDKTTMVEMSNMPYSNVPSSVVPTILPGSFTPEGTSGSTPLMYTPSGTPSPDGSSYMTGSGSTLIPGGSTFGMGSTPIPSGVRTHKPLGMVPVSIQMPDGSSYSPDGISMTVSGPQTTKSGTNGETSPTATTVLTTGTDDSSRHTILPTGTTVVDQDGSTTVILSTASPTESFGSTITPGVTPAPKTNEPNKIKGGSRMVKQKNICYPGSRNPRCRFQQPYSEVPPCMSEIPCNYPLECQQFPYLEKCRAFQGMRVPQGYGLGPQNHGFGPQNHGFGPQNHGFGPHTSYGYPPNAGVGLNPLNFAYGPQYGPGHYNRPPFGPHKNVFRPFGGPQSAGYRPPFGLTQPGFPQIVPGKQNQYPLFKKRTFGPMRPNGFNGGEFGPMMHGLNGPFPQPLGDESATSWNKPYHFGLPNRSGVPTSGNGKMDTEGQSTDVNSPGPFGEGVWFGPHGLGDKPVLDSSQEKLGEVPAGYQFIRPDSDGRMKIPKKGGRGWYELWYNPGMSEKEGWIQVWNNKHLRGEWKKKK